MERKGVYYERVVDGQVIDEVLELHKRDTVSTFGTRSSTKRASQKLDGSTHNKDETKENSDDNTEKVIQHHLFTCMIMSDRYNCYMFC